MPANLAAIANDPNPYYEEQRISYVLMTANNWATSIGRFRLVVDKGEADALDSRSLLMLAQAVAGRALPVTVLTQPGAVPPRRPPTAAPPPPRRRGTRTAGIAIPGGLAGPGRS